MHFYLDSAVDARLLSTNFVDNSIQDCRKVMLVTRKIDYGFLALAHLARRPPGGYSTIREIARAQRIPQKFLSVILKRLVNQGIIVSRLGPAGGYALAHSPRRLTFMRIMEALEGPLYLNNCLARPRRCARRKCAFGPIWKSIQRSFEKTLQSYSLADIVHYYKA